MNEHCQGCGLLDVPALTSTGQQLYLTWGLKVLLLSSAGGMCGSQMAPVTPPSGDLHSHFTKLIYVTQITWQK